jgi:hypothetical protein
MSSNHTASDAQAEPVWGAPTAPQRWGLRQTAAAVGVAAVIAGLGGAGIYAATDGGEHSMGTPHPGFAPGGPGGPPPGAISGPGRDGAAPLHGEFVVPDGNGGYTTLLTQTGTITAISATSITARSDDGYTQTYTMPPTAAPPFAVNDQVVIRATRTGDTPTVTSIGDPNLGGPAGPPFRN